MLATKCGDSPALTDGHHQRLADELRAAARDRRRVEAVSARHPELNLADARWIRDLVLAGRLAEGEQLAGTGASLSTISSTRTGNRVWRCGSPGR